MSFQRFFYWHFCHAVGAYIFKNKLVRFVIVYILPPQQNAQAYSWKGSSKLHAASVITEFIEVAELIDGIA